jgi:hypothetical protein
MSRMSPRPKPIADRRIGCLPLASERVVPTESDRGSLAPSPCFGMFSWPGNRPSPESAEPKGEPPRLYRSVQRRHPDAGGMPPFRLCFNLLQTGTRRGCHRGGPVLNDSHLSLLEGHHVR